MEQGLFDSASELADFRAAGLSCFHQLRVQCVQRQRKQPALMELRCYEGTRVGGRQIERKNKKKTILQMHSVEEDVMAPQAAAASQGHLVSSMLLGEKKTLALLMGMQDGLMQPSKQGRHIHSELLPWNHQPVGRLHCCIIYSSVFQPRCRDTTTVYHEILSAVP